MLEHLRLIATVLALLSLLLTSAVWAVALCAPRRRRAARALPPITVLKPVKGLDEGLAENLEAIARQDYPDFEMVIGAADPRDPALAVARALKARHPGLRIAVVSGEGAAINPKVANLSRMLRAARNDVVLVSDSNVRPGPGYLARLAAELDDRRVGLVSSVLCGVGAQGGGAALENLILNTFIAASVSSAHVVDAPCTVGKSLLLRRSQLERLGGLAAVGDVLAEDYCLGRLYADAGHRVALCHDALPVVHVRRSLAETAARHVRWSQMRRRVAPAAFAAEPLLNPLPFVAVAAAAGARHAALLWLGLALKYLLDGAMVRRLRGRAPSPFEWTLLPVRDALLAVAWFVGLVRRRVSWRGREFVLGPGSRLLPAPPRWWRRRAVVR